MCRLLAFLYVLDLSGGRLTGFHRHIWFAVTRESTTLGGFNWIFIYLPPLCAIGTGLTFARRSPKPQFCLTYLFCFWKQVTFKKLSFHSYTPKVHPYCIGVPPKFTFSRKRLFYKHTTPPRARAHTHTHTQFADRRIRHMPARTNDCITTIFIMGINNSKYEGLWSTNSSHGDPLHVPRSYTTWSLTM